MAGPGDHLIAQERLSVEFSVQLAYRFVLVAEGVFLIAEPVTKVRVARAFGGAAEELAHFFGIAYLAAEVFAVKMQGAPQAVEFILLALSQFALAWNADVMAVGDVAQLGFEVLVGPYADVGKMANIFMLGFFVDQAIDRRVAEDFLDGLADKIAI
jgi:uncharacterized protein YjeT (DUF2065 family)